MRTGGPGKFTNWIHDNFNTKFEMHFGYVTVYTELCSTNGKTVLLVEECLSVCACFE